jgi:transmembrane sensor
MSNFIPEQLIIRFLSNEATSDEQDELFDWINRDPKNQKVFQEYYSLWNKKVDAVPAFQMKRGLQKLNSRIDAFEVEKKKNLRPRLQWQKLAAAVLLLTATGLGLWSLTTSFYKPGVEIVYHTAIGKNDRSTVIILPDHSEVRLNARSTLKYPEKFSGSHREVFLTGEGFFNITRDETHAFIIHTAGMDTEVLGTSFNIKEDGLNSIVTVATGKVKVSGAGQTQILMPHQKILYDRQFRVMKTIATNTDEELSWIQNTIVFNDTDLLTASKTLQDWYDVKIHLDNNTIGKCRITGKFKNESLQHILEAIAFSTGVKFKINNKTVQLSGDGC